jgi:hypothetical protein
VRQALFGTRQRIAIFAIVLGSVVLFVAMVSWVGYLVVDSIGAPGPSATGSGPCGSADSVNLQLVSAEGHTVQACTRDRPACPNVKNPDQPDASRFELKNQLRSSSRRYILLVQFDAALPAEAAEETLDLAGFPPGESAANTMSRAIIQLTPRDPGEIGYTTVSGSLTVSSTHGVARGRIDGNFTGPTRPDRPAPTPIPGSPVQIAGTFACNH